MPVVGLVCAWVLAALFVWAGAAKLARPRLTAVGFRSLGVPAPDALARIVPATELLLAVLLVATPPIGGLTALVLLAGFSVMLARALRAGVTTGCACFGTTPSRPMSRRDLLRNAAFAVLAVAAVLA
ncbi:MAG: hypothetical protein M3179_07265 [Actinomycetota bacterium]|nr:hypothetical protein [Actinomycetota bacterium]